MDALGQELLASMQSEAANDADFLKNAETALSCCRDIRNGVDGFKNLQGVISSDRKIHAIAVRIARRL